MSDPLGLQPNEIATVAYSEEFGSENLKLVELDEDLLQELISKGLTIKGGEEDEAVLCSSDKTFSIRVVGSTNTLFLTSQTTHSKEYSIDHHAIESSSYSDSSIKEKTGVNPSVFIQVIDKPSGTWEVVKIPPRLDLLKKLLDERPLEEDEAINYHKNQKSKSKSKQIQNENSESINAMPVSTSFDLMKPHRDNEIQSGNRNFSSSAAAATLNASSIPMDASEKFYSTHFLLENVQASEKELMNALHHMHALEMNGEWRILHSDYEKCMVDMLILNAVANGLSLSALDQTKIVGLCEKDGFLPFLIEHCLSIYGNKSNDSDCSENVWALDDKKICLHFAFKLLSSVSSYRVDDFMEVWTKNVPTGMLPKLDMLKGEALVDEKGDEKWIKLFSVSSLPSSPLERFQILFKVKERWLWEDIEPYLSDLGAMGHSVENLLLKYTRKIQTEDNEQALYCPRF